MKKLVKYSLALIICTLPTLLSAQVQLERQVIGASGSESSSASLKISSTVGETAVETAVNPNFIYTQGFQQPMGSLSSRTLEIFLSTTGASCRGRNNGLARIDSLAGCQPPYQIVWSAGASPIDSNQAVGLAPGDYTVQIISNDGCNEIFPYTIGLIDAEECLLKFYSGITPNGDGRNDRWIIDNVELFPQNKVRIYNRFGNMVFDGENYDNNTVVWEGRNLSGNELPSGTYFYLFESNSDVEKGWIELTK